MFHQLKNRFFHFRFPSSSSHKLPTTPEILKIFFLTDLDQPQSIRDELLQYFTSSNVYESDTGITFNMREILINNKAVQFLIYHMGNQEKVIDPNHYQKKIHSLVILLDITRPNWLETAKNALKKYTGHENVFGMAFGNGKLTPEIVRQFNQLVSTHNLRPDSCIINPYDRTDLSLKLDKILIATKRLTQESFPQQASTKNARSTFAI